MDTLPSPPKWLKFVDDPEPPPRSTFLSDLVVTCQSLSGADKVVKTIGYAAGLLSCVLDLGGNQADRDGVVAALRKIYGDVCIARMVYRFNGTMGALEAFKKGSWAEQDDEAHMRRLVQIQTLSMVGYHPLELVYWSAYVAPQIFRLGDHECHHKRVAKVGAMSCWFWTLYVVVDIYLTLKRLEKLRRRLRDAETSCGSDSLAERTVLKRKERALVLQLWRSALYLPNAIHWSFPTGLLPESCVQFFGLAESIVGLIQAWPQKGIPA